MFYIKTKALIVKLLFLKQLHIKTLSKIKIIIKNLNIYTLEYTYLNV